MVGFLIPDECNKRLYVQYDHIEGTQTLMQIIILNIIWIDYSLTSSIVGFLAVFNGG